MRVISGAVRDTHQYYPPFSTPHLCNYRSAQCLLGQGRDLASPRRPAVCRAKVPRQQAVRRRQAVSGAGIVIAVEPECRYTLAHALSVRNTVHVRRKFMWNRAFWTALKKEESVKRGEHAVAPECKGERNARSPRKPAGQRHLLARFRSEKIRQSPGCLRGNSELTQRRQDVFLEEARLTVFRAALFMLRGSSGIRTTLQRSSLVSFRSSFRLESKQIREKQNFSPCSKVKEGLKRRRRRLWPSPPPEEPSRRSSPWGVVWRHFSLWGGGGVLAPEQLSGQIARLRYCGNSNFEWRNTRPGKYSENNCARQKNDEIERGGAIVTGAALGENSSSISGPAQLISVFYILPESLPKCARLFLSHMRRCRFPPLPTVKFKAAFVSTVDQVQIQDPLESVLDFSEGQSISLGYSSYSLTEERTKTIREARWWTAQTTSPTPRQTGYCSRLDLHIWDVAIGQLIFPVVCHRARWRSGNSLDSHSGEHGFDSRASHPDFGFPWFPEITPGECWDGSLTKADSFLFLSQSLFPSDANPKSKLKTAHPFVGGRNRLAGLRKTRSFSRFSLYEPRPLNMSARKLTVKPQEYPFESVKRLAFHHRTFTPNFFRVGTSVDVTVVSGFSRRTCVSRHCIPLLIHLNLSSCTWALNTKLVSSVQGLKCTFLITPLNIKPGHERDLQQLIANTQVRKPPTLERKQGRVCLTTRRYMPASRWVRRLSSSGHRQEKSTEMVRNQLEIDGWWGRGGRAVSPFTSQHGEPGSISGRVTGFSHVGIVPDDAVGWWVFSGISRFPRPFFRHCSILTSITLIGSQDLAVMSCPNLFTNGSRGGGAGCNVRVTRAKWVRWQGRQWLALGLAEVVITSRQINDSRSKCVGRRAARAIAAQQLAPRTAAAALAQFAADEWLQLMKPSNDVVTHKPLKRAADLKYREVPCILLVIGHNTFSIARATMCLSVPSACRELRECKWS
ncbi:hypothetical protein PR048_009882 [Dryococelus australis]|uniref:Uncharacterized protein n=1 Tax=Dryococelus australis TaxID=614101 RepID=A0ABQ9I173_9NEOP|nr:hypothetical protein PR048_009882 [Dryococelus australis]